MSIKLKGSSDGSVSFDAPADTSPSGSDITLTLPTSAGSANQFLKNSGIAGELEYSSMVETSTGVGVGTTSPTVLMELKSTEPYLQFTDSAAASGYSRIMGTHQGALVLSADTSNSVSTSHLRFDVDGTERMRVDANGRLLIGTSSSSTNDTLVLQGNSAGSTFGANLRLRRNATIGAGSGIGQISFEDASGNEYAAIAGQGDSASGVNDYPGRIIFSTTANNGSSPVERARFNRTGTFNQSTNISDSDRYGNTNQNIFHSHIENNVAFLIEHSGANPYGMLIDFSDASPDDNTKYFLGCIDSTGTRLLVHSDGDLDNHDNSYGSISDQKLKQDIVDAGSQWDDIKNLRVRKFKFKSDVAEYGDEAKTLIGVVAQETELVSPGLVKESPDKDREGNDLGTTTKFVRYSVLYMKAVKALQEAQTRIETLESQYADLLARVTALEAA